MAEAMGRGATTEFEMIKSNDCPACKLEQELDSGSEDEEEGDEAESSGSVTPPRLDHETSHRSSPDSPTASQQKKKMTKANARRVGVMIAFTFCFFFVELIVGLLNNSIALLADSYHMLSDVMALSVAFLCVIIANRRSRRNGFGWVRAEVLGALSNGVFLLAMCMGVALESVGRLVHPSGIREPHRVLIVGLIGLAINLVGIFLFHGGHGHSHGGSDHQHEGHSHEHNGDAKASCNKLKPANGQTNGSRRSVAGDNAEELQPLTAENDAPSQPQHVATTKVPSTRNSRAASRISADTETRISHNHLALRYVSLDGQPPIEEFVDENDGLDVTTTSGRSASAEGKHSHHAENLNMRGALLHIISDAIGSVFVVITAGLTILCPVDWAIYRYVPYLDPILSLLLVSLISTTAFRLVNDTAQIVLQRTPKFVDVDAIRRQAAKIKRVIHVENVRVWTLVGNRHLATAEVRLASPARFNKTVARLRHVFHSHGIHSLTIQPHFAALPATKPIANHRDESSLPASSPAPLKTATVETAKTEA